MNDDAQKEREQDQKRFEELKKSWPRPLGIRRETESRTEKVVTAALEQQIIAACSIAMEIGFLRAGGLLRDAAAAIRTGVKP